MERVREWHPAVPAESRIRLPRYWSFALCCGVFILSLALYLSTLAPTITWRFSGFDSGELAAAAYTWGIPHPTGYPLWTLLGFLITRLPFRDPAFGTNLLSALCAAAAAALVALATLRLCNRLLAPPGATLQILAAATAGLALATAPAFWSQATLTETYSLHCLLIAIVVCLLAKPVQSTRPRGRLAFICGLALTNHVTAVFTVVASALVVLMRKRLRWMSIAGFLVTGAVFVLPLLLYLLIPWRAGQHPAENWNDPETFGRFMQLVSGAQYRYLFAWREPLAALTSVPAILRLAVGQFAWWGLPLAIYGLLAVWEIDRPFGVFALITVVAYGAFTAFYRAAGAERYLLPAYLIEAALIGVGFAAAGRNLTSLAAAWRRPPIMPSFVLGTVALLTVVPFAAVHYAGQNLRRDRSAYEYARATLVTAAPGDTLLTDRDEETFSLWYLQKVRGFRRDVQVRDVRISAR